VIVKIADCTPRKESALGATLGEQHMAFIQRQVADRSLPEGTTVILDFTGVPAVNGSYIKATAYWLFLCGKLSAVRNPQDFVSRHLSDPRPYEVFMAVAGLDPEVEEEFVDFFQTRQAPLLVARQWEGESIASASLMGHLEPALKATLSALLKGSGGSAPALHAAHPGEKVTVTAWNNRLSDLYALRLVRRARVGKVWEYQPIAKEIAYGRGIH
jgi:hypothetical protein